MNSQITYPDTKDITEMVTRAEEIFGTQFDPTQAEPTIENTLSVITIEKNNVVCIKEDERVVAWSVVLPTSKLNMEKFLTRVISEKELSDESKKNPSFETLYLMAAITLPLYQRKGFAFHLLKYQIEYFKNKYNIQNFYSLPFSENGMSLIEKTANELNLVIKIPSHI